MEEEFKSLLTGHAIKENLKDLTTEVIKLREELAAMKAASEKELSSRWNTRFFLIFSMFILFTYLSTTLDRLPNDVFRKFFLESPIRDSLCRF